MGFKGTRLKKEHKRGVIKKINNVDDLPTGHRWLPISIVAFHFGVSTQTIRNLFDSGQINCYQFPVGPMLFSAEEVELVWHAS